MEEMEGTPEVGGEETRETQERDFEAEAKAMGWKEEFDGPNKLDPKEFVLRKPLFDEMKKLRKKTKELENAIRTQTQMQEQLLERERADLLQQYKTAKVAAIEEGDARKVVELDEEIDKIKNQPIQKTQVNQEFVAWSAENEWYDTDDDCRLWADAYGLRQHQANPNRPASEIYAEISRKVKEAFPHKFKNMKREEPTAVTSNETGRTKTVDDEPAIPKDYKQVFHTMWRSGAWGDKTMKDAMKIYAADLKKIGAM